MKLNKDKILDKIILGVFALVVCLLLFCSILFIIGISKTIEIVETQGLRAVIERIWEGEKVK